MSSGSRADHSRMSAPTQKALSPSAVRMTMRTCGSASSSRANASSASSIAAVSACSLATRASVTVAMSPSRSSRTSSTPCLRGFELQAEGRRIEQGGIHGTQVAPHAQPNLRLVEHVALQIDAGRDFLDHQAIVFQLDHAALGNVSDALAALAPDAAAEGDVLARLHELPGAALLENSEPAVPDFELRARGEEPREDNAPCIRGDIDEAAATGSQVGFRRELRDVDAAIAVDL